MLDLLFSPSGRLKPEEFMRGIIVLIIISAVLALLPLVSMSLASILSLLSIVMIWCWVVLYVKRFHDAGKSGWMTLAVIVVMIIISMIVNKLVISLFASDMNAAIQKAAMEAAQSGDIGGMFKSSMAAGGAMAKKTAIPSAIAGAAVSYIVAMGVNKFFPHEPQDNKYGSA